MIAEKQKLDDRKFELISDFEEQQTFFKDIYTYMPKLMEYLWDDPKTISKLLINSNIEDVKKNLAPFFVNNFYENILSSVYIEDNLMYLISLLLMEEIKGIEKPENYNQFLEETATGYVLEQLKNKTDVQNYFKTIIFSLVEKLETISLSKKINLNPKELEENNNHPNDLTDKSNQKIQKLDKTIYKKTTLNQEEISELNNLEDESNDNMKNKKQKLLFEKIYIPDITKEELERRIKENERSKGMKEYINMQIKNSQNNLSIFSNGKFLNNLLAVDYPTDILTIYQIEFFKIIEIIDELFTNLMNNIYLIPYSVKCICKIILLLIRKKNPNISIIEQNILISRFFFNKLFLPIFKNPGFGALINNFIISGTTIHNLDIISQVIEKFLSGNLIKTDEFNGNFSPFNKYFLNKMPEALKFFEKIIKVSLPPFIENLINGYLPNDYVFNYFKENPEEVVLHKSICFSLDDFLVLLSNMNDCKSKLFINKNTINFEKTFNRFFSTSSQKIIEELKEKEEFEKIVNEKKKKEKKGRKILKFFLFTDLLVNNKYLKLFELKQDKPNFTIKELEQTQNEKERQKNNVIKIKNFLSSLLYNYRTLVKTDFDEGTTLNTIKILRELKKFMKTSNFVIDGSIPSEWYVNSLITQLKLLSPELQSNDFENLYKTFEIDIKNSIKELDFETISICLGKVKFAQRGKVYYENAKKAIIDLELNERAQLIIEKEPIPVIININYNKKEFKIEKGKSIKEVPQSEIFRDNNEKKKICPSIESFVYKFPNIEQFQLYDDDDDLFKVEKQLKLSEGISDYFKIIKDYLTQNLKIEESSTEFQNINNKIYDYVMEKIYEKIYPSFPQEYDNIIFRNCILLSWVEPKHFINAKKNYIFDSFLPDVIGFFNKIENEKSPRKKLLYMSKIFVSIENVVKFNGDNKDLGVDDQLPILTYAFIKTHPFFIYTDYQFMELFIGEKKSQSEGNQLAQLECACQFVLQINYSNLNDMTEEKFTKNCQLASYYEV